MLSTSSTNTPNPYPGLRPYQPNEQKNFYGRDTDTQALLTKILNQRLTLLFAATGVGKSSLLQAAILPQLTDEQGLSLDAIYYNDWVAPPIKGIQQAVHQSLTKRYGNILADPHTLRLEAFFRLITPSTSQPLVIILDQFEEFFRYRFIHHVADFQPFIDQLAEVILAPELNVSLVFSMREDFALELNAFKPHLPNPLFSNYYRLEKLGIDAAKSAITEPLIQAGYHYEPALLDELLNDLLSRDLTRDASSLAKGTQADSVEPPYLQIVCSQLWELDKQDSAKTLRLATYRKAGGAKGLLENYVNYVLKSFSDREKQVTSKAFDHLISRRGTKMAHTPEDLAELVNLKPSELANVMDKLEKARILRRQQRDQQVWYELYHDMFSGGIEAWNTAWKNHMRLRRSLIGTAASLATLAAIYFGVVGYLQATSKHLRLGNNSNSRVEIYTGSSKFPDPFGQQHYLSETSFERSQLELDKRYPKRDIPDYPLVVRDLIASQPLESRINTYVNNGEFCQFSDLLNQVFTLEQPAPGCKLPNYHLSTIQTQQVTDDAKASRIASNPELDGMMQLMLQNLGMMKTDWAFTQKQTIIQQINAVQNGRLTHYELFLDQPVHYTSEEMLSQALVQQGAVGLDPRYLELTLAWALEPERFAVQTSIRPIEMVNLLLDGNLLVSVMNAMQIKPRLSTALTSDNPQTREIAAVLIGQTRDANFSPALHKALLDKAPTVRQAALRSLFQINLDEALTIAAKRLNEPNQTLDTRFLLITSLGQSQSLKAVPLLLERFQDTNEREEIRQAAATQLGNLGATEAIPIFHAVLSNLDERVEARLGAIEELTLLNDLTSIESLLKHLQDSEERIDIRTAAASALGRLEVQAAVPILLDLLERSDTDENFKYSAISALSSMQHPSLIPRLTAYLKTLPVTSNVAMQLEVMLENLIIPQHGIEAATQLSNTHKQFLVQMSTQASTPFYQPAHSTLSVDSNLVNLITGNYDQRQALMTAWAIQDQNRNSALLRIALDTHTTTSIRAQALLAIQATGSDQAVAAALLPLTKDSASQIRVQSTDALLRLLEGEALLAWLSSSDIAVSTLRTALARYVATSPRATAIKHLISFAQDANSPLQTEAYTQLAELKATEALSVIKEGLANLEAAYRQWRKLRDQQPTDLSDTAAYTDWQTRFAAAQPKQAGLAFYYGYALAQMGFEQALIALNHDLADVRLGASISWGKYATVANLQALAQERLQRPEQPLFQQASYMALNQALLSLELSTDSKEIKALEIWQTQAQEHSTDPISQRLAWTIRMIKHYQQLDQLFATKYQLKRKS